MAMHENLNKSLNKQAGFTLIEIMVVVIIIALLGAIVGPVVFNRLEQAQITRVEQDIRAIDSALKLYRLDNLSYPTQAQGLEALVREPAGARAWRGPYLERIPVDPWNQQPYRYRIPSQHGLDYDIFTFGADNAEGGEGQDADLGNWNLF